MLSGRRSSLRSRDPGRRRVTPWPGRWPGSTSGRRSRRRGCRRRQKTLRARTLRLLPGRSADGPSRRSWRWVGEPCRARGWRVAPSPAMRHNITFRPFSPLPSGVERAEVPFGESELRGRKRRKTTKLHMGGQGEEAAPELADRARKVVGAPGRPRAWRVGGIRCDREATRRHPKCYVAARNPRGGERERGRGVVVGR